MLRRQEVLERIKATPELQDALQVMFVQWGTLVVGIQDILLDEEPLRCRNDAHVGPMPLEADEEVRQRGEWKKNLIGGRKFVNCECARVYWYPPQGSKLFQLMRIEHEERDLPSWAYYLLLLEDGKHVFLEKRASGRENQLRSLDEGICATYFSAALGNALMWKPSPKDED